MVRYTNLTGLLALVGTVAGLVATGIVYPINLYAAVPFAFLAIASFIVFVRYVYHFLRYSPIGDVPDDEAKAFYTEDE